MGSKWRGEGPDIGEQHGWNVLDDHLLYTCGVVHDVAAGRIGERAPIPTRARLHQGELSLAVGPAARSTWRALGNGSYVNSSTVAFGSASFVIGSMVGSAVGNAARRNKAISDAQPRWLPDGPGELTVTDRRAVFGQQQNPLDLGWTGLDSVELIAPEIVQCSFQDTYGKGYMTVQLHTLWASLVFVLAARTAFPAHPRLLQGDWLPPGFEARCAAMGRHCPQVR
ncbi:MULTISPECIES: hypothetical protein [unclassified Streptomyces]|uniref:hypothetical protein n=1 Tax=unclassified Streptomyces TaxID=2593676 RepID=UPI002E1E34CA|nr:hypothetical protein OG217_11405 [Streptomyces sp. NBC_01023]